MPLRLIEPQDRHQHQDRAEHGVQDEFHRGVNSAAMSPDADEEIHRNQRQFPEDEEQEKVERDEDADHGGLDDQQRDEKSLHVFVDGLPGTENRQRREKSGEQHEEQADAVHADVVMDGAADPGMHFHELKSGCAGIEARQQ